MGFLPSVNENVLDSKHVNIVCPLSRAHYKIMSKNTHNQPTLGSRQNTRTRRHNLIKQRHATRTKSTPSKSGDGFCLAVVLAFGTCTHSMSYVPRLPRTRACMCMTPWTTVGCVPDAARVFCDVHGLIGASVSSGACAASA